MSWHISVPGTRIKITGSNILSLKAIGPIELLEMEVRREVGVIDVSTTGACSQHIVAYRAVAKT
jgi:hypothetical protein